MRRRRSPIHLKSEHDPVFASWARKGEFPWAEVPVTTRWQPREGGPGLRAALFRYRSRPDYHAILAPSTKQRGMWQLSYFDAEGPSGDIQRATVAKALYDGLDGGARKWRLETVVDADGVTYGKELV